MWFEALKCLGFICRFCTSFRGILTIKLLLIAFVRFKVEHGSLVWAPSTQLYIDGLEKL